MLDNVAIVQCVYRVRQEKTVFLDGHLCSCVAIGDPVRALQSFYQLSRNANDMQLARVTITQVDGIPERKPLAGRR